MDRLGLDLDLALRGAGMRVHACMHELVVCLLTGWPIGRAMRLAYGQWVGWR
jgi:hypothetical protein